MINILTLTSQIRVLQELYLGINRRMDTNDVSTSVVLNWRQCCLPGDNTQTCGDSLWLSRLGGVRDQGCHRASYKAQAGLTTKDHLAPMGSSAEVEKP